jgi:Holliday junction DNA helicase RuvA
MITHLRGNIIELSPTHLILDCNGIGYYLNISLNTFSKMNKVESDNCKILTYLHVREDAHTLFGFFEQEERKIFLMLLSVSGIGASTAMMILSSLNSNEIRMAILKEDIVTLKSIKGIGMKSAQRIIIDLKDKITNLQLEQVDVLSQHDNIKRNEALSALETLGFSVKDINKVLDNILSENPDISVEQVIKMSLKRL